MCGVKDVKAESSESKDYAGFTALILTILLIPPVGSVVLTVPIVGIFSFVG